MRENNQIIKPGDNDGLRTTQYLQCFAIFCGLDCQMSPNTLFSQKKKEEAQYLSEKAICLHWVVQNLFRSLFGWILK